MKLKSLLLIFLTITSLQLLADAPFNDKFETPSWDIETSIYPNPNNGSFQLNIQSDFPETFEVKVVNLIGKTITKKEVKSNFETSFDLTSYPKGVYFLQIKAGQKQITKRVIVQ